MHAAAAEEFASEWIAAWNSHEIERVLAHWADDCVFTSPYIESLLGDPSGQVRGKDALRRYWTVALERIPDLKFELVAVYAGFDGLVIQYTNHRGQHVAECLRLGSDGLAIEGNAYYRG